MSESPGRKRFTILHSNDIHGDFQAEIVNGVAGRLIGGLSRLSGYINAVRRAEKNVLYFIAGDMVRGSMIDSEYKGVSTMELMNYLAPDAATIGNHEFDYGLYHLLFLEKMANFPIVVSNLYIKKYHKRLMRPYLVLQVDGLEILIIGIVSNDIIAQLNLESDIGSFLSLEDASEEVGRICNAYKDEDIDLTIVLSHIGFEADQQLAAMLNPEWGVDLIIGGHSHTVLEQPAEVNGIVIAQAGVGTDQVGRFDLIVDEASNRIVEWNWKLLDVDEKLAEPDETLQRYIASFQEIVDRKYNTILCRFARELTHPTRSAETELGNLFADIIAENAGSDLALLNSGAIRGKRLGPLVTLGDFRAVFPYNTSIHRVILQGAQLKEIFRYMLHPARSARAVPQVSGGVRAIYDAAARELKSLSVGKVPVQDGARYTVSLPDYLYQSSQAKLGVPREALLANGQPRVATTSMLEVVEEYLRNHQNLATGIEGRLSFE